jgi:hypothetical protein
MWGLLDTMYSNPPKNWLAGASIQLALNGTHLPWTSDGWSFVPIDLSNVFGVKVVHQNESGAVLIHPTNVIFPTDGIRARLECPPIAEASNVSSWLAPNTTENEVEFYRDDYNTNGLEDSYWLNHTMFDGTPSNTSVFCGLGHGSILLQRNRWCS